MTTPPFSVAPGQGWLNTGTTPPQAMKRNASNTAWEPARPALGAALADTHHCSFFDTPALIRAFRDWLAREQLAPTALRELLEAQAQIAERNPHPNPAMTTPLKKIGALCEKHGFSLYIETPSFLPLAIPFLDIRFDRDEHPKASFQLCGTNEQIYQQFLAVLQATGLESPTPTGISAGDILSGPDWYKVVDATAHDTIKVGDIVQMVRTPSGADFWLYRLDGTLHDLQNDLGDYVNLIGKPLPTPDAPPPTPIQFNINDSAKVRLTDYGRDILRQKLDSRHSFEQVDAQGYTRFKLWELMNIFGLHIYNGAMRQCFDANIVLLDSPQS